VLVFDWSTISPTHSVGVVLGRRSVVWIALELESTVAQYYQTQLAVSRLNCAQLSAYLLTCHSLACDTHWRARSSVLMDAGTYFYVLILVGRPLIHKPRPTPPPFSLYSTRQSTAVYWLWPSTHECALLFALHLLYPDYRIQNLRRPNIEKSAGSGCWPNSELTAGSGFRTRIRHIPFSWCNDGVGWHKKTGSEILGSWAERQMRRNSVWTDLVTRVEDIHWETGSTVAWRCEMLVKNSEVTKEMKSWLSSVYIWWPTDESDMRELRGVV